MKMEGIDKALKRNLDELHNATLKRRALIGISNSNSSHALDFFRIAEQALSNDMRSHLMRVFDKPKDTASYWKCIEICGQEYSDAVSKFNVDILKIEKASKGLRHIRNKTHFHIDKNAVLNPKQIYIDANVTYNEIDYLLEYGYKILSYIYETKTGKKRDAIPEYDGSDVADIIKSYKECFPNISIILNGSF